MSRAATAKIDTAPHLSIGQSPDVIQAHAAILETMAKIGDGKYHSVRATAPPMSTKIKQALQVPGVDPGVRTVQGLDAIEVFSAAWLAGSPDNRVNVVALRMVGLLVEAGYPLLDRPALSTMPLSLCEALARQIASNTKDGRPLLGKDGGNICHWLASRSATRFAICLHKDAMVLLPSSRCFLPSMITDPRHSDGATALHALWSCPPETPADRASWLQTVWMCTEQAVERFSFDLSTPDDAGTTVLDAISHAGGFEIEVSPLFQAACQHSLLMSRSPCSDGNTPSPRL